MNDTENQKFIFSSIIPLILDLEGVPVLQIMFKGDSGPQQLKLNLLSMFWLIGTYKYAGVPKSNTRDQSKLQFISNTILIEP